MTSVKYVNSRGQEIVLSDFPYIIQSGNLFDWKWAYDVTEHRDTGAKITAFYSPVKTVDVDIAVYAETRAGLADAMNRFNAVVSADVADMAPGKLLVGDYYLICYVTASVKTVWDKNFKVAMYACTLAIIDPAWTRETWHSFMTRDDIDEVLWGLDYPYDYPYDYTPGKQSRVIELASFEPCGFVMVVFGPTVNPLVAIGPNTYAVGDSAHPLMLRANEWVTIDSRAKSIIKHHADGKDESVLNLRNKDRRFFVPIPPGISTVSSSAFFDLKVFERRSEPPWM